MRKRFRLRSLALCLGLFGTISAIAQSSTREEEIVRNAYAKVTLLASLPTAVEQAAAQANPKANLAVLPPAIPFYTLSDFHVGPISEIENTKKVDLVSEVGFLKPPAAILLGAFNEQWNSVDSHGVEVHSQYWQHWQYGRFHWSKEYRVFTEEEAKAASS